MSKFESTIQKDLVTDAVFTESNEEFILPDYMPEIGRILRVTASLFPEECYLGTDAAEFSGRVEYRLFYSGGEGTLTEAPLLGRYRYRIPVGERRIVTAHTDERVESVAVRPSAPRKLGIRTRITATPHLLYEETVGVSPTVLVGDAPMEISEGQCEVAKEHAIPYSILHSEGAFTVEDTLPDELSLLSAEGAVLIEGVEAKDGYLTARGRVIVTLILQKTEGIPFIKVCTLPFEEDITTEYCREGDAISLCGAVVPPSVSFEEAGADTSLLISTEYTLHGFCTRNEEITVLRDFYVHGARHSVEYHTLTLPALVGCYTGNVTAEGDVALPADFSADEKCIVPSFRLKEKSITRLAERGVVTGTLDVLLLALGKDDNEKAELSLPFRIEFPLGRSACEDEALWVSLAPIGGEARLSGKSVHLSTELSVTARATRPSEIEYPVSAVKTEDIRPDEGSTVTIYYPSDGDTLWSVGKAYARPLSLLRKQNGFPPEGEPAACDAASLDGYAYLLIDSL